MYQALYRQYRPKTFNQLLGQDHITKTLKNQVQTGNIGHAYLFSGTRGTGKTSAAKILSRAVNCLDPQEGNPCNKCDHCKGILEETSMDVIEMDAASNNSVEDIRDLREKVVYPPSKIKYKVYIIDEVHMLSKGAFNALLKTLEEPPKHLIFILATTEPERLPQTILSRCQRFDFKRISNKDLIYNMKNILEELNIEVEDSALSLIARNSDGAMRDALSLLDQCVSFNDERVSYEDAIEILGVANKDLIFNMVNDIKNKNMEKTLLAIDGIIQDGKDIHQFIKDLIDHFRNLMIVKSSENPKEILMVDDMEVYREQSKLMDLDYILKALEILTTAQTQGKWSTQARIILEMAAIKLVKIEDGLSLEKRIARLEKGYSPEKIGQKPIENQEKQRSEKVEVEKQVIDKTALSEKKLAKTASIVEDGKDLSLETIQEHWPKVMQQIKTKKINIYALIMEGKAISYSNKLLTICYDEGFEFHKDAVSSPSNKEFVEEIASAYFNKDISINFTMKNNITIKEEAETDDSEKAIKEVIDFFGENIVEIK